MSVMEYTVRCVLVLVLLNFAKGVSSVEVKFSHNPIATGENVTLEILPPTHIEIGTWSHETDMIVLWFSNNPPQVFGNYPGRVTFDASTGTLILKNVTLEDSGSYIIQGLSPSLRVSASLSVQEPVSDVRVSANETNLVEFNDTVSLTCSASGSSLSYQWHNGDTDITSSGRIQLSDNNKTLTISSVSRSDQGPLYCTVSNGISNGTSQLILLNISYGPSNLKLTPNPSKPVYRTESDLVLRCSADSNPPAYYSWAFQGALINQKGPDLRLDNVQQSQSGNYTCWAHNDVTLRYASVTTWITIIEPISEIEVNASGKQPILNESFTLSCEVSGPADSICWLKDGSFLSINSRITFSVDNSSVTFNPVQLSDDGSYQCEAFNAVSNGTSPKHQLLVKYGPEEPVITGPSLAVTGSTVTFNCTAASRPPSQYSWYFNGTRVAESSVYETGPLTSASHRTYTCMAFNSVTGGNSTATKELNVISPVSPVTVSPSTSFPILSSSLTLSCDVTGAANTIHWLKDGQILVPDNRTTFSLDNSSVTFNPVQLSDDGNYQCEAYNAVSNGTSPKYQVLVNYGPDEPVITGPSLAVTGSTVTFSCTAASRPPSQYSWYFNGTRVAESSVYETGPLTSASHRTYTCVAFNSVTGRNSTATKELNVILPVSPVTVSPSMSFPILSSSLTLSCDVTGAADTIRWLKDSQILVPDNRTTFSLDNSSVTFNPVQLSDDGDYQCEAYNAVSNGTSPKYQVLVNYGPEEPVITGPSFAGTGSTVTFSCTATSQPPSQYSWYFNGTRVAESSVYETGPLTSASHRTYTCVAFNSVTGRNSTATKELNVILPVSPVTVSPSTSFPKLSSSLTLSCDVTGAANTIHWLKDAQILVPDNRTTFSLDNSSVTFNPVQLSDDGSYQCEAFNAVSNGTSPNYQLLVNYGPEEPVITGPSLAETGSTVTFNCTAASRPPSQYSWYFNGTRVAESSVYETGPLTSASHRKYTCVAFNSVTGRNSTAVKELTVTAPISSVMVRPSSSIPILSFNLTLTCDVSGVFNSIYWMKDGQVFSENENRTFSVDNSSVSFNPVQILDDGIYQCVASNSFSEKTSPGYKLLVSYGPDTPVIQGPHTVEAGFRVTLTCTAFSQPPSHYYWKLNNNTEILSTANVLTITSSTSSAGHYMCVARNPLTNVTAMATFSLNVTEPSAAPGLLSSGGLTLTALLGLSVPLLTDWLSH